MNHDWKSEALRLWVAGRSVREISEAVGEPLEVVSPYLAQRTAAAIDAALRGGGWK